MKKPMVIVVIIILVIVTVFCRSNTGGSDSKNTINNTKLPVEYEDYQSISPEKTIRFGNYEMKLLFDSFEPIHHFISSQNNLIVITSKIPTDRNQEEVKNDNRGGGTVIFQDFTTYKLNKDGDILDSYVFKRTHENFTELLFGDYIINTRKQYYRTWVLDGNPEEKPFVTQNKDLQWDEEHQVSLYEKIYNEAKYYIIVGDNYRTGGKSPKLEIVYFMNNEWYKLLINCDLPDSKNNKDQRGEMTYLSNLFGQYTKYEWGDLPDYQFFKPVYFQRINREVVRHNIGGGMPSSTEPVWKGNLFCQLYVDNDTLKFIKPMIFGEYGETEKYFKSNGAEIAQHKDALEIFYYPYFYYTNKNLNFKLFTPTKDKLYIIKPVK